MTGSTPTPAPRRRRQRRGVIAVVCVALVAWLAASIDSDADELVAGPRPISDVDSSAGARLPAASVRVPNAVYLLEVFAGRRPDAVKRSKDASTQDGYVVSVSATRLDASAAGDLTGLTGTSPTQVWARSGQQTCPLATLAPDGKSEVTVTDDSDCVMLGDAEDLRVVVGFAGREQVLDPYRGALSTGDLAGLYTAGGPRPTFAPLTSSSASVWSGTRPVRGWEWTPTQNLDGVTRVPYLPDLGWAARGHEWAVVQGATTGPVHTSSGGPESVRIYPVAASPATPAEYRAGAATGGLTVNGATAVRRLRDPRPYRMSSAPAQGGMTAFSVTRGAPLTLRAWTAVPAVRESDARSGPAPGAPARVVLRSEMRVHVPPPVLLGTGGRS